MEFPQRFGKYTLLKRIATGGMADIFLAHMRSLQGFEKEVVVKRLRPEHAANPDLVGMFLDEARTAANLTHANVAQIFDLGGDAEAGHFIAMEFVRGVDLRRVCEQGIAESNYLPLHHAVRIMADVCDALAYAHGEVSAGGTPLKVVHRDVSPTNILVSYDGAVKLIDFGIAKARTQSTLTKVGQIKGKFGYMAPEQCLGMDVDARTDIFAVGINLYEVTLGRRLFRGETEVETLEQIEACEIEPPRSVNPRYPEALERIVMRALARDPAERYQDARQMQMALEEFLVGAGLRSTSGMLAAYMRRIFREQIAVENEELNELRGQARSLPPAAVAPVSTSLPPGPLTASQPPLGARAPALSAPPKQISLPAASAPAPAVSAPVPAVSAPAPAASAPEPSAPAPAAAPEEPTPAPQAAPAAQATPAPQAATPAPQPGPVTPAPAAQPAPREIIAPPSRRPDAAASVVVDPSLTSPGLRAEAATPAPAASGAAPLMNPWSTFTAPPPRTATRTRPSFEGAGFQPPPEVTVDDDDLRIRSPRNFLTPILILLVIAGGGYGLYTVMMRDSSSDKTRGNPNMEVAPPRLQDLAQVDAGAPRPPPAKAMLRIETTPPGAVALVNGAFAGVTPTAYQTFADQAATVRLLLEGHQPVEQQLLVSGAEAAVNVTLEPGAVATGTLDLASTPDAAEVYLNGQAVGTTPMKLEKLPAGFMHTLRLRRSGFYDHTVLADVEAEKESKLHVRMAPAVGERVMATVLVETNPIGATVTLVESDGEKAQGRTTARDGVLVNARIDHPLHLRASLDRHSPALANLDVKDPAYTLYLRLAPPVVQYGALSVAGTKGLTVYVGPEEVGKTPVKDARVKAGEHDLVIVDEATGKRFEGKITIEKDKTASRKATSADGRVTVE